MSEDRIDETHPVSTARAGWGAAFFALLGCVLFSAGFAATHALVGDHGTTAGYALMDIIVPTIIGSALMAAAVRRMSWQDAVVEQFRLERRGILFAPAISVVVMVAFMAVRGNWGGLTGSNLPLAVASSLMLAAASQVAFNGYLVAGLRQAMPEVMAWLCSTLLFSAALSLRVFAGGFRISVAGLVVAFCLAHALYLLRRVSGNLLAPALVLGSFNFYGSYINSGIQGSTVVGLAGFALLLLTPITAAAVFWPRAKQPAH